MMLMALPQPQAPGEHPVLPSPGQGREVITEG